LDIEIVVGTPEELANLNFNDLCGAYF